MFTKCPLVLISRHCRLVRCIAASGRPRKIEVVGVRRDAGEPPRAIRRRHEPGKFPITLIERTVLYGSRLHIALDQHCFWRHHTSDKEDITRPSYPLDFLWGIRRYSFWRVHVRVSFSSQLVNLVQAARKDPYSEWIHIIIYYPLFRYHPQFCLSAQPLPFFAFYILSTTEKQPLFEKFRGRFLQAFRNFGLLSNSVGFKGHWSTWHCTENTVPLFELPRMRSLCQVQSQGK